MSFLNPMYLFALAAVAVPILIHIFSRRRVPEVPFSTIRFLHPSDRRSMVRINLRRLLLLFLRIFGIALLVLVFARPVVRGGLAALFPAGGSRAACILLDRSYSMGVEGDGGTAFERGTRRLSSILDNLAKGDAVTVVLFDTAPEVVYDGEPQKEAVLGALKEAKPSWSGTDLRSATAFGVRTLEGSRREARELYVISDFQRSAFSAKGSGGEGSGAPRGRAEGKRAERERPDDKRAKEKRARELPVRAFLLPIQTAAGANVAVEEVLTPRVTLHKGEIAELKLLFRNTSPSLSAKFPFEVSVGGRRVMEKEVEIPPDDYRTEAVTLPAERFGWIEGVVKKRPDRLPADDARFFSLHVEEKTRVLLLSDGESFYLEQALSPGGVEGKGGAPGSTASQRSVGAQGKEGASAGGIAVAKKGWRAFSTNDLKTADVVILGPGKGPQPVDIDLIERFVAGGGRAIVLLLPELKDAALRLSRFPLKLEFADMPQGFFSIAKPAAPPPFLAPFSEEDMAALARLRFRRAALVSGAPREASLLAFTGGSPFVWEEKRGKGTAIFAAIDPRPEAGELVLSPYFLPLVQQLVLAAGAMAPDAGGSLIGEPIVWKEEPGGDLLCRLPDGRSLKPEHVASGAPLAGGEEALIPPVETPGFVSIYAGAELEGTIAVNPDCRRESELDFMPAKEAADSLGLASRLVVDERAELGPALHTAREGIEISMPLLLAAIALFVAESVVAQREKGEPA